MSRLILRISTILVFAPPFAPTLVHAQQPVDPSRLSLARIFSSAEFRAQRPGETTWLDDSTYATLQTSTAGGVDLVAYSASTGVRRVVVAASAFVPPKATAPLDVEGYQWSADRSRLLIFTNSARVWRENTRGDFWVLDVAAESPSDGAITALTNDGSRTVINGTFDWVCEEELYLRDSSYSFTTNKPFQMMANADNRP